MSLNPAIREFVQRMGARLLWGEVVIQRQAEAFDLRHVRDESRDRSSLRLVNATELRERVSRTEAEAFRPLKSAPNLPGNWVILARDAAELWQVLNVLYPGSVADWHQMLDSDFRPISFEAFAGRQSGMYRIVGGLESRLALGVARAVCQKRFCVKDRRWTVGDESSSRTEEGMAIPCLDPCAILLDAARKAARTAQEPPIDLELAPSDLELMLGAVEQSIQAALADPAAGTETDPRRLQLLLEKYRPVLEAAPRVAQKE